VVAPTRPPGPLAVPGRIRQCAALADDGRDTPPGHAVTVQPHGWPPIAAHGLGAGGGPRRSVERGHGSVGAGARRGPRPYVSGATARPTTQLPAPNGQPGQWRLRFPLPRSRARKRV